MSCRICCCCASIARFISPSWVETLAADVLATAFFLVPLLLPAVVFCGAGAAKAPTTSANDNAKTIPCFISPPESFESGQPVKYWCDLTCRTDGTVDASYSLLRIDEYSINLG